MCSSTVHSTQESRSHKCHGSLGRQSPKASRTPQHNTISRLSGRMPVTSASTTDPKKGTSAGGCKEGVSPPQTVFIKALHPPPASKSKEHTQVQRSKAGNWADAFSKVLTIQTCRTQVQIPRNHVNARHRDNHLPNIAGEGTKRQEYQGLRPLNPAKSVRSTFNERLYLKNKLESNGGRP